MRAEVLFCDETTAGEVEERFVLHLASERVTARELLESRIREEVVAYNRSLPEYFQGLVRPTEAERSLKGYRVRKRKPIDADEQLAEASTAFERNAFLMIVGDTQVLDLDQEVVLTGKTRVRFLRLVPLVGG